ncbi:ImuA family protein [Sphingobacterium hungaricum]|uniref:Error-prone repair protein ImuA n=1 Tax=Sphingobacterium hungaricum TaxID=2082723 RepID=A0A928YP06_9SPHI|nr:Error-prone repair protein ImuA [Sphingobacterium hungaricum]MBE8712424.1 Error-prone repair protein ImuA [Sphingobacterium hungaricum]
MEGTAKKEIIKVLRESILKIEGFKSVTNEMDQPDCMLNDMASAFPYGRFPTGAIHEFISPTAACATSANGFIAGLLSALMANGLPCLWISTKRSLFPAGLKYYGIEPHQVIFIDVKKNKDALWVMEQGLKCNAVAVVVAELNEVSFSESQRLQLAVEQSRVTGFLHRKRPHKENTLACVSRWKIRPKKSYIIDDLPGVGFPMWEVQLEKIRNGKPGKWVFGWRDKQFVSIPLTPLQKIPVLKMEQYG